ncbi:E3 SUMO-protein ligase KIAA1586-like [Ruditapes philippinarum]|uniref:E3 SUMO-protein ligase KIAA1586-like n=1 Tax=Ruditapes philippinarum TaxID=129788 RepID=UPI00295AD3AA|nr:E3 SUMO-protein ligase KIAA1586-like [Ruditapes philippinarum]
MYQPCTWIVRKAITRHQTSDAHKEAAAFEANRSAPKTIHGVVEEMTSLQLQARVAAFRNLYWLIKQEMPHTSNYLALMQLCKEQGVNILSNLDQGGNNNGQSQRFIQEAVLTMGQCLRDNLLEKVRESPWYTIMVDETTDVAVLSEMIVYISQTEYLSIVPHKDGKADTITTAILELLSSCNLPLQQMRAFGSDGAAVMVGKKTGVAVQLRQRVPHLISNNCVAHRLALAVAQAVKGVPYLPRFKDILGDLHRFYDHSPVRTSGLKDIQKLLNEPVLKLVEAKAEERNDVRAAGLARFTQDHRFVMSLHMMCDTLPHLTELSTAMQARDAIYTTVKPLVTGTLSILRGLQTMQGEAYQSAVQRVKDLQAQGFNIKPPSEQETVNFREKVFNPFMENIVNNLEGRFPDLPLIQKFEVFNTRKFPDDNSTSHGEEDIKMLTEHFGLVVDKTLHEWRQVRESIADSGHAADKAM